MADSRARTPQRLILDSGALIALAKGDTRARAYLQQALRLGILIEVPAVVLAETLRGGARDAPIHRVLNAVQRIVDTSANHGRKAGELLGSAQSKATIDAIVVAHAALAGHSCVLTGDPDDLRKLADASTQTVQIEVLSDLP